MSIGFGHLARISQLYPSAGIADYETQKMALVNALRLTGIRQPVDGFGMLLKEIDRQGTPYGRIRRERHTWMLSDETDLPQRLIALTMPINEMTRIHSQR